MGKNYNNIPDFYVLVWGRARRVMCKVMDQPLYRIRLILVVRGNPK